MEHPGPDSHVDQQRHRADGDGQGVLADIAGLQPPEQRSRPSGQAGDGDDGAVDDGAVDGVGAEAGQQLAGPADETVGDVVEVEGLLARLSPEEQ